MELMTAKEIAEILYLRPAVIHDWAERSRIKRYPDPKRSTRHLFDFEEAERASKTNKFNDKTTDKLITPTEAAALIGKCKRSIGYYVDRGYIKAHYVFEGNTRNYLVDKDEVLAQRELVVERKKHLGRREELAKQGRNMHRSADGRWAKP